MITMIERRIAIFSQWVGKLAAVLLLLLLANVFFDVVMRYFFNDVSIGMQELEWHLYASVFLLGMSYALEQDGHVRVDLLYERHSAKLQALINILGTLFLLMPMAVLIAYYGFDFAASAYEIGESSGDPGGLAYRWIIKSMIGVSFSCLLITSVGFILRAWRTGFVEPNA